MELGSLTYFAVHPDATVHWPEMLGDGQTQASATGFSRARDAAVEALKMRGRL